MKLSAKRVSALLISGLFLALVWFNYQRPRQKSDPAPTGPVAPQVVSNPTAISTSAIQEPRHFRPKRVTDDVRRKADDIIRRYKDMPAEELAKQTEFSALLELFMQRFDTPEFQHKINERLEAIKATTGKEHGTLSFGTGKLDSPEGRAWLEAMFSEDPQMMEEFIINKLDGAIFELAFDPTLEKTSDGVAVTGNPAMETATVKQPD